MMSTSPPGAGASLRSQKTPSQAQRERKREVDRRSQRAVRERTKTYIAQLERQNEALIALSQHTSHAQLATQVREQAAENDRLREVVRKVQTLAAECLGGELSTTSTATTAAAEVKALGEPSGEQISPSITESSATHDAAPSEPSLLACGDGMRDYFGTVNQALELMETASRGLPCPDASIDEDILLTAMLHGWPAARAKHHFDAGWQLLRLIDDGLFYRSGAVERAATLRIMRTMSLVASRATVPPRQRPPAYMSPTALQAAIPHPRLVDYFAWPSIRDMFVATGAREVPESLTAKFAADLGFRWDFELRDIARRNVATGRYEVSRDFDEAWRELDRWFFRSDLIASLMPPQAESLDGLLMDEMALEDGTGVGVGHDERGGQLSGLDGGAFASLIDVDLSATGL